MVSGVLSLSFLPFTVDLVLLFLLLVVGLLIIVFIAKVIAFILPGVIVGAVVWFLTGSFSLAGIAFIVIAFLSLLKS